MAQEQSYSQNQKQTQTQIQIQKTDKDEIIINTLDTEEEIPEIPEDSDNDDYSETYINKNEKAAPLSCFYAWTKNGNR